VIAKVEKQSPNLMWFRYFHCEFPIGSTCALGRGKV
jgi:hypothetical protein